MMTRGFLRRAIQLAEDGVAAGGEPYGSLLVGPDGERAGRGLQHGRAGPRHQRAPRAQAGGLGGPRARPGTAAGTTMYTSCQPCSMCTGALARSGLGRVVFALSNEQHAELVPGERASRLPQDGPALFDGSAPAHRGLLRRGAVAAHSGQAATSASEPTELRAQHRPAGPRQPLDQLAGDPGRVVRRDVGRDAAGVHPVACRR